MSEIKGRELKAPINGIFFDLGWTLLTPTSGNWMQSIALQELYAKRGIGELDEKRVNAAFNRAQQFLNDNHKVQSVEEEYEQFRKYYEMISEDLPELSITSAELDEIAKEKVYDMDIYRLFDDTIETLEYLSKKYRLGVISDTWPSLENYLKFTGIDKYFDSITFSCYLGTCKPQPAMYNHALNLLGVPASETIFVDDFGMNVLGAAKVGIQPVQIKAKPVEFEHNLLAGATDNDVSDKVTVIHKISDLIDLL